MIDLKEILLNNSNCKSDPRLLKSLLLDLYPRENRAIINIITMLLENGFVAELEAEGSSSVSLINKWCAKFENEYGSRPEKVKECITIWSNGLDFSRGKEECAVHNPISSEMSKFNVISKVEKEYAFGDIIKFGLYKQNNGVQSIEWNILKIKDGKALLISKYALDYKSFHDSLFGTTRVGTSWKYCTLREWLNDSFFNMAFSMEEQSLIHDTRVITVSRYGSRSVTVDKIFLLSIEEAKEYFADNESLRCAPTEYAKSQGAKTRTKGNVDSCFWWLRSTDAYVGYGGAICFNGDSVNHVRGAIRPVMWINLLI